MPPIGAIFSSTYHTKQQFTAACLFVQERWSHLQNTYTLVNVWQASETKASQASVLSGFIKPVTYLASYMRSRLLWSCLILVGTGHCYSEKYHWVTLTDHQHSHHCSHHYFALPLTCKCNNRTYYYDLSTKWSEDSFIKLIHQLQHVCLGTLWMK